MTILNDLAATIAARRDANPDTSWTTALLSKGSAKCAEKFGEEAIETIVAAVQGDRENLTKEAADVIYHLLVLLEASNVRFDAVLEELKRREGISGIDEKAAR